MFTISIRRKQVKFKISTFITIYIYLRTITHHLLSKFWQLHLGFQKKTRRLLQVSVDLVQSTALCVCAMDPLVSTQNGHGVGKIPYFISLFPRENDHFSPWGSTCRWTNIQNFMCCLRDLQNRAIFAKIRAVLSAIFFDHFRVSIEICAGRI